MKVLNHFYWLIPFVIGLIISGIGAHNELVNVVTLGIMVMSCGLTILLYSIAERLILESEDPADQLRTEPVCCICDGGPGNTKSPTCKCGHKMWDIDPVDDAVRHVAS